MASVESDVQAVESKDLVPLTLTASCCPGCCDDAERAAATDAPCC
jgi:hypothetical protein